MTPAEAVNHIGIAVRSIDAQQSYYQGTLGAVFEGIEVVPDQKVRVGFFRIGDVWTSPRKVDTGLRIFPCSACRS